jgi:Domain of unknown function (DUF4625)
MNKHFLTFVIAALFAFNANAQTAATYLNFSTKIIAPIQLNASTAQVGTAAKLMVDIAHLLGSDATESTVRVYLSDDKHFDFKDNMLESFNLENATQFQFEVNIPTDAVTGKYHLLVVVQSEVGVLTSKCMDLPLEIVR